MIPIMTSQPIQLVYRQRGKKLDAQWDLCTVFRTHLKNNSMHFGRTEIDNVAGLKTMVENKEIPVEEMQIFTSSKYNCTDSYPTKNRIQESIKKWST